MTQIQRWDGEIRPAFFFISWSYAPAAGRHPLLTPAAGSPSLFYPFPPYTAWASLYTATVSPVAPCPPGYAFSRAKVLPGKHIQVPLTLFERNFPVAFPIFNRPYLADAPYRNDKIPPKFLVCCFLVRQSLTHVKIKSRREKPEGFRKKGK